jgi:hypothetical protein
MLIDKLAENRYYIPNLENIVVSNEILKAFDVEHIDIVALLWQTGYLTFAKTETFMSITSYTLKVPNIEVQISLNALFNSYLTKLNGNQVKQNTVSRAIYHADFPVVERELISLFAAISYHNHTQNPMAHYEGYYASVVYTFLASLGFNVIAEDTTNTGRIDMTLITPQSIVIIEFKVDKSEEAALEQIKTNRYYEKYLSEGKEIYFIGIHFSSKTKNIEDFLWEKFQ